MASDEDEHDGAARADRDERGSGGEDDAGPSRRTQALVVGGLVLVAGALAWFLATRGEGPTRRPVEVGSPRVEVVRVEPGPHTLTVEAYGRAEASAVIALAPRVAGRVVAVAPGLVEGGVVDGGEALVQLDEDDARSALAEARARLERLEAEARKVDSSEEAARAERASADAELRRLRSEADVSVAAYREQEGADATPPPLLAKEPQLAAARAAVQAAEAGLEDAAAERDSIAAQRREAEVRLAQARRELERTSVELPGEDGARYRLLARSVAAGDTVTVGQVLARLYRLDEVEVRVPLSDHELDRLALPDADGERGAPATLTARRGRAVRTWQGHLARVAGEVDPSTRRTDAFVVVDDVGAAEHPRDLLVPGTFVEVRLTGAELDGIGVVPTAALRGPDGEEVWAVVDDTLRVLAVEPVARGAEEALVRGLEGPVELVLTRLDAVTEGMSVRVVEPASAEADG